MTEYGFNTEALALLGRAVSDARRRGHEYVGTEHILAAALADSGDHASTLLQAVGADRALIAQQLDKLIVAGKGSSGNGNLPHTTRATRSIEEAMAESREMEDDHIGAGHLLCGLIRERVGIGGQLLLANGVTLERLRQARTGGTPSAAAPWQRLNSALDVAEALLRGMSEEDAATPPAPGKWSPKQIIGHLVDSASNNHQRFVRGVWQGSLVFPGYEQDKWVALQEYQDAPWPELVTLWVTFNRHIARVMKAVPKDARLRVHAKHNLDEIASYAPTHPSQATLDYFMHDYVDHIDLHMRQIFGDRWITSSR